MVAFICGLRNLPSYPKLHPTTITLLESGLLHSAKHFCWRQPRNLSRAKAKDAQIKVLSRLKKAYSDNTFNKRHCVYSELDI